MNKYFESVVTRAGRAVLVGALASVGVITLTAPPAAAIVEMNVGLSIYQLGNGNWAAWYAATLPTDTGWGYLNNGASITVSCYADDHLVRDPDDLLFTKVHTLSNNTSAHELWAFDEFGYISLSDFREEPPGGLFDEDVGQDEIYCRLTWRDADGVTIARKTAVEIGEF